MRAENNSFRAVSTSLCAVVSSVLNFCIHKNVYKTSKLKVKRSHLDLKMIFRRAFSFGAGEARTLECFWPAQKSNY